MHHLQHNQHCGDLCEACADRPSLEETQQANRHKRELREKASDMAGPALYHMPKADRESLVKFAKCKSFYQFEATPRKEMIDVIGRWIEARTGQQHGLF